MLSGTPVVGHSHRSPFRVMLLCALAVFSVMRTNGGSSPGAGSATSLERYAAVDEGLALTRPWQVTSSVVVASRSALEACTDRLSPEKERCLLDVLLSDRGFAAATDQSPPRASTLGGVIEEGRGTCAALVATILSLTAGESAFEAVVFRDHVVLVSARDPTLYYEVLERGRLLDDADLERFRRATPLEIRVDAAGFLPFYLDNLAARLARAGDTERALAAWGKALSSAPDAGRIRYNYGSFLLERGENDAALTQFERAISTGWIDADTLTNRGAALWKTGDLDGARAAFREALEMDAHHREALANLRALDRSAPGHP